MRSLFQYNNVDLIALLKEIREKQAIYLSEKSAYYNFNFIEKKPYQFNMQHRFYWEPIIIHSSPKTLLLNEEIMTDNGEYKEEGTDIEENMRKG